MATSQTGKQIAARNAVRHGALALKTPVVPKMERQEDWKAHFDGIMAALAPATAMETALAERIAATLWRLSRVGRYERELLALAQETVTTTRRFEILRDASAASVRAPDDALDEAVYDEQALLSLQAVARALDDPNDAPVSAHDANSVLVSLSNAVRPDGLDLEDFPLPGVPDDACLDEFDKWTNAIMRGALRAMATKDGRQPDEFLAAVVFDAMVRANISRATAARVRQAIGRARRRDLLPDDETLQRITRYESHLSRQLYAAMHELEALQARRIGQPAPLARLDVSVSPEA